MEKNIFKLDNEQLKAIVCSFRDKTEEGLKRKMQRYNAFLPSLLQKQPILKESHWYLTWEEPIIGWQS